MCCEWEDAGRTGAPSECAWSLVETSAVGVGDAHEMWKSCSLDMGGCCNDGSNFGKVLLVALFPLRSPLGRGENPSRHEEYSCNKPRPCWEGCNVVGRSSSAGGGCITELGIIRII